MARYFGPPKLDRNHRAIVDALEAVGASVMSTANVGGGFPDLVVGFRGRDYLIEIKNLKSRYGRAGLSKGQRKFVGGWKGTRPVLVTSPAQAVALLGFGIAI